jgi:hypothetical protein
MVKKVKYSLIDTNILPPDMVCRNNAYENFISVDEYFSSEWLRLTTKISNTREKILSQLNDSKIDIKKAEIFFSPSNGCGLLLIE